MFPSCKAVLDTISIYKYVTDIMQQLIPVCYLYWQIVLLYQQEQLFICKELHNVFSNMSQLFKKS